MWKNWQMNHMNVSMLVCKVLSSLFHCDLVSVNGKHTVLHEEGHLRSSSSAYLKK